MPTVASSAGGSEIGIIYQGNTNPEIALAELLGEFGSEVTGTVLRPEGGGYLVSITKPEDPDVSSALMSALGSGSRIRHVESNVCYEFYPERSPNEERALHTPNPPTPADFLNGDRPEWTDEGLTSSETETGGREYHSTTRTNNSQLHPNSAHGRLDHGQGSGRWYDSSRNARGIDTSRIRLHEL
ncbi:MAG: hypothetical protein GKR90_13395 [Pseudomonadales bacterium]|nr:hypothetical protein [Pseudomonadales bacterium]